MAVDDVVGEGEVILNAKRYRTKGDVRVSKASNLVAKQIFGDFDKRSHRDTSTRGMSSWTGGIGLERVKGKENLDRAFWSTFDLRQDDHLGLAPLATETPGFASSRTGDVLVNELGGAIVASVGQFVQSLNGTWTERTDLGAAATGAINITLTTTEFLCYAFTTGYEFSSSIATWVASAKNVIKFADWRNQLWGIDATGQLWRSYTVGSAEVNDALLPLSHNDTVTDMFVGSFGDDEVIYVTTKKALWRHDYGNREFVKTNMTLPANTAASGIAKQGTLWRGIVTVAANTGFNRILGSTIEAVRLGHDDGLKNTREGRVFCMADSIADLLVGTKPVNSTDRGLILQWNDSNGFQVLFEAEGDNLAIESLHVSDAVTNYRCWFGYNDAVWFVRLHDTVGNPGQVQGWTYSDQVARHETPWTNEDTIDSKVLLELRINTKDLTSAIYIKPYFAIDDSFSWTEITDSFTNSAIGPDFDITNDRLEASTAVNTFKFPSVAAPAGTEYRTLRWRFDGATGTSTITPDMIEAWYTFVTQADNKLSFAFQLDMTQDAPDGRSPLEQQIDFDTALASKILVTFTHKSGKDDFYVDVSLGESDEESGFQAEGQVLVRCTEPS